MRLPLRTLGDHPPRWRAALLACLPATLFGRLACLLVAFALASHVLALGVLFELRPPPPGPRHGAAQPWPEPGPAGVGPAGLAWHGAGPPPGAAPSAALPWAPPPGPKPSWLPPGRPVVLWLDILVRVAALLLAARIAAGWLARPIQRLAQATQDFGQRVGVAAEGNEAGLASNNRAVGTPDAVHPAARLGQTAQPLAALPEDGPREVRDAARVFNRMRERICQQLDERDRFVAAVSHDLRTPLTRLRLRTESLADAHQRGQFCRDIHEMEQMIRVTLDHLRGAAEAEPRVLLDVQALADALSEDQQACGHDVRLLGQAAPLLAQATALRRCLGNLVDNAVRYGGQAQVRLIDSAQALVIEVADNGPGLPEAELHKVLAPFYRVEGSRNRAHGGVGLGLSIAHDIARQHGGALVLRNRSGGGLVASLRLPR